jgi:phage shock protein PspC (stress-responsive transcriptional regulator)
MVRAPPPREHRAMSSSLPPSDTPPPTPAPEPPAAEPRRLFRSRKDRVLGGVCGGIAEYFRIDPIIVRLAAVALVLAGGAGVLLYLAALLLVPEEGGAPLHERSGWGRALTLGGIVLLVVALGAIIPGNFGWGWGGDVIGPLLFLGVAGLLIWRLVSGEHAAGTGRDTARRIGLGLLVLIVGVALAVGSFWAAAAGGTTVVATLVIVAGLALAGAAFRPGGARWLIPPALAVALPAAFVAAAGIDVSGGLGDRDYRPTSAAQVRDRYELGAGQMVVDLRAAQLPAGDRHLRLRLGMGDAVVLVPRGVCVATSGRIGAGAVNLYGHHQGGVDVDLDEQPAARPGGTRLVVDADIGLGALEVHHSMRERDRGWNAGSDTPRDAGCAGAAA